MEPDFTWHDLEQDHGVLELAEDVTAPGPPLELDVHLTEDGVSVLVYRRRDDAVGRLRLSS